MSFSSEVKEELAGHVSSSRHCQLAELSAVICFLGRVEMGGKSGIRLGIQTENETVLRKCFTLLKKTFNIDGDALQFPREEGKGHTYVTITEDSGEADKILQAVKMRGPDGGENTEAVKVNPLLIKNACCKRAFLRGAFLCIGSMSDPEKSYHLEFVCLTRRQALQLQEIIRDFDIEARIVTRKNHDIVYMKEGAGIVDLLNVTGAHISLMNLENLRIVKEMRNSINRRVNCETANITKTVNASTKQIQDIMLIQKTLGLKGLQDSLREVAEVRLEYPEATLKELGEYLNPPVGKSGVNHRLRKLSEIAERIRG